MRMSWAGTPSSAMADTPYSGSIMTSPLFRQEQQRSPAQGSRPATPSSRRPNSARGNRSATRDGASIEVTEYGKFVGDVKAGRVKVGIRCRPAFQDEIDFAKGQFMSIIDTTEENPDHETLGRVKLTLLSGKQRDFMFDYVFHQDSSQDAVFDRIAKPVVDDVLRGFNGTIFAYGQTGTGKTYTMGILESVEDEHAGIIPRAIARIFDYVNNGLADTSTDVKITLSFLQLYREAIQDLLAPASSGDGGSKGRMNPHKASSDDNLVIREDPQKGFYVEGLQEFIVRDYREAEALINLGLENRAIAPTLMNATSSRSHTVLTLSIEQRGLKVGSRTKNVRSKLLMVDLAGSERVRRTISKGTRLNEARSINTSLSALGNVIAALAEDRNVHVPYRDSKLTRLLQDSLGGTASTALVATVGPAPMNYSETLSTLLFAARCMSVKTTPIQHEEVDYAEMCANLQERLSTIESRLNAKHQAQQARYQEQIKELQHQLDNGGGGLTSATPGGAGSTKRQSISMANLESMLTHFKDLGKGGPNARGGGSWLQRGLHKSADGKVLLPLLAYSFELIKALTSDLASVLTENVIREEQRKIDMISSFSEEAERESVRELELEAMNANDPLSDAEAAGKFQIGNHLAKLSKLEALTRIEGLYRGNNGKGYEPALPASRLMNDDLSRYRSPEELAEALTSIHENASRNMHRVSVLMSRKDSHYKSVKDELSNEMVEKRRREEEVVNWSYILKYLLASSSKLRKQLHTEKKVREMLEMERGVDTSMVPDFSASPESMVDAKHGNHGEGARSPESLQSRVDSAGSPVLSPLERVRARMDVMKAHEEREGGRSGSDLQGRAPALAERLVQKDPRESAKRAAMERNRQSVRDAQKERLEEDNSDDDWEEEEEEEEEEEVVEEVEEEGFERYRELQAQRQGHQVTPGTGKGRMSMLESSIPAMYRPKTAGSERKSTPAVGMPGVVASPAVKGSGFAKKVVSNLGVKGDDANTAAAIIDRVAQITPAQLEALDPATRAQVMRVRRELKLEEPDSLSAPRHDPPSNSDDVPSIPSPPSPRHRTMSHSEKYGQEPAPQELRDHYRPERAGKTWNDPAAPAPVSVSTRKADPPSKGESESMKARTRRRRSFLDLL